jgi:sigma-B regulation protein RsbU (phosphoserine phosphatase)
MWSPGKGIERLPANDPPLGMDERAPATVSRPWNRDTDLLVLFTDGVSDARNRDGARLGENAVLQIVRSFAGAEPSTILDRIIETLDEHRDGAVLRDDLTIVLVRS